MGKLIDLQKRNGFKISAKTVSSAEITIYAPIGQDFWGEAISASSFSRELDSLPDTITNIDVRLNSPGGDVFDGITIYNRLRQHKASVTVYVDGMAASIASIIALAGDEIVMGEGAQFMIHKPMSFGFGNNLDFEALIDRLNDVEDQLGS